uniref:Uncharacterized protein n=1 Tax=Arundo donax TaxID=35708 RepID=A0A0A8YLS3_ARUDO
MEGCQSNHRAGPRIQGPKYHNGRQKASSN